MVARDAGIDLARGHLIEIGPGDSIGLGVAAVLSGVERYTALDMVRYADPLPDRGLVDEISSLYVEQSPIPDDDEFPDVWPKLRSYRFPDGLPDPVRVKQRAMRLSQPGIPPLMRYRAPWGGDKDTFGPADALLSQAVLEHVDDLPELYDSMAAWLAPGALVSHTIDFRAHATSTRWNGHLSYPDILWSLAKGKRDYLLNREPLSTHVRLLEDRGFEIRSIQRNTQDIDPSVPLNPRFSRWSDEDKTTSVAHVSAVKTGLPSHEQFVEE